MDVKLIMFREDGSRRDFNLSRGVTTVGRKQDCTIRIPLSVISRRHAELHMNQAALTLRDLGAANGTFLNNRRVQEEELEAGDQIAIGPVVFTVQINGEPSEDEIIRVRSKVGSAKSLGKRGATVATSKHVYISDEDMDPIAALEALASSADQTAISPGDEFEMTDD